MSEEIITPLPFGQRRICLCHIISSLEESFFVSYQNLGLMRFHRPVSCFL